MTTVVPACMTREITRPIDRAILRFYIEKGYRDGDGDADESHYRYEALRGSWRDELCHYDKSGCRALNYAMTICRDCHDTNGRFSMVR